MPKYAYTAKTRDAKLIREREDASSKEEIISRLRSRGLFVISVSEIKHGEHTQGLKTAKRSSLKLYDFTFLARNLATTLGSGVTMLRSLELLSAQAESAKLEAILKRCIEDIKSGLSLSEALSRHKQFSALWYGLIEVGESSGNLPFVLEKLADYLEMRMDFERKIKSALVYPIILFCMGGIAIGFFVKFVMPKFAVIFSQMSLDLPLATKILFNISNALEKNFLIIIIVIIFIIGFLSFLKQQKTFMKIWDEVSLKLPLLKNILLLLGLERFTSTMYILLDSGLPLVYSVDVAARSIGNYSLEEKLISVKEKVKEGVPLSEELKKTQSFPAMVSEMAKIGEETGSMPEVFKKISTYYQKELTSRMERFVTAFEPVMIVVMGVIIGAIVISLFLPLFKLSTMGS